MPGLLPRPFLRFSAETEVTAIIAPFAVAIVLTLSQRIYVGITYSVKETFR